MTHKFEEGITMKKLLAGMLVLSLGLFTLGCGGGEKKVEKKPAAGGGTPAPSAPSTPAPGGEKK
jgi:hypothetical protein